MRSVTRRVDVDIDVAAVADSGFLWAHEGDVFCGAGVAASIVIPEQGYGGVASEIEALFGAMAVENEVDRLGSGPLAFTALPFAHDAPFRIVVPQVCYGRDRSGARWITWTGAGPVPSVRELVAQLEGADRDGGRYPQSFAVRSVRPEHEWRLAVASVRDQLRAGVARKAVMAREVVVECDAPIVRRKVIERLRSAYPSCFVFAVPYGAQAALVGASPELLVSRVGDVVRSQPMAGTTRRSPDPQTDARLAALLLSSQKDRIEHQITIDVVHERLLPWCSYLDAETAPSIVSMANVHHLATYVEGRLSKPAPSVLELAIALHPTPAVCGHPDDAARKLIAEYELMDRGAYAGAVGWFDRHGQGEFAVGVRLAEIDAMHARLFAGVGVVADSDPNAELEETRAKFEAMLGAILRP